MIRPELLVGVDVGNVEVMVADGDGVRARSDQLGAGLSGAGGGEQDCQCESFHSSDEFSTAFAVCV